MLQYFKQRGGTVYGVVTSRALTDSEMERLCWLLGGATPLKGSRVKGTFVGPRREMITPWSTNAVEITHNMGLDCVERIEQFRRSATEELSFDKMLERVYQGLGPHSLDIDGKPADVVYIDDLHAYNEAEGLALSADEEAYLQQLSEKLGRPLTDSEVFGFSQVNSEHCRHKIFNGTFVIDGKEMPLSLFKLIKSTSQQNPGLLVSAYKDNVAFVEGPKIQQFYPENPDRPGYFTQRTIDTVLSLKAETHNFPTTVEPFNGAATGSGGEIRDRLGGGRASLPLAGTAVYMTSYPRLTDGHPWEMMMNPRAWLYQTPAEILIKASNGASDFGNKYGQPLICGSLLTFEQDDCGRLYAYDKVIMLAGGVGFASRKDAIKGTPTTGEKVIVMGGDNYRIGMGGGAVSSVATGQYDNSIELNAVQRANPEMQKRVANVIRALAESERNPITSIHDHGAGGHLNALSELVEETGGHIDVDTLPIGDPTLSAREIIGNESQERMGMVMHAEDVDYVKRVADRERAPMYVVGETTGDHHLTFERADGSKPLDLDIVDMLGNTPHTVMTDTTVERPHESVDTDSAKIDQYIEGVLSLEAVASKDWLTNKVDRSITGKIARQQCQGELQLPLSDCGVVALDFTAEKGIATSIGHAPQVALIDPAAGSQLSIAEALTNLVGAPLAHGLKGVSLSANWMWPCRNQGEDARLYKAVEACSNLAKQLGINIPTGKDSLSMTQKYGEKKVFAPGTVIISAASETVDVRRTISPVMKQKDSVICYVDFSSMPLSLGGSALAQSLGRVGQECPGVADAKRFADTFETVQTLVKKGWLYAAHDVSAGGLITTLLEMTFARTSGGMTINTDAFVEAGETDLVKILFAENPAVVLQIPEQRWESAKKVLDKAGVRYMPIGCPDIDRCILLRHEDTERLFGIDYLRDVWYRPSYELDRLQSGAKCAAERFDNYRKQPVRYAIPAAFDGSLVSRRLDAARTHKTGVRAAILREKGTNGEREMAWSLYLAGFDVKDVHLSDLMEGRETLDDVNLIVFCGGFSNSDVLGSAKGWAAGFKWNETASTTLRRYYARPDTLSLGICNGCQLMMELNLLGLDEQHACAMEHNVSHKFESAFVGVHIPKNNSVMLSSLEGYRLGIWVAHGEGRFNLPRPAKEYNVALQYNYNGYPGNPNGSRSAVAGLCSADGRHLAMMPHLERAIYPWQCGVYPDGRRMEDVTPWIDAFINARKWVESNRVTK